MAGQFQNRREEHLKFLSDWVDNSIDCRSWENHQDLHLDEIDRDFNQKDHWLEGALYIYKILYSIISHESYSCLLVIPMSYAESPTNINLLKWNEINSSLDLTPPSFYLFPNGEKNYEDTIKNLTYCLELSHKIGFDTFFKENEESEQEFNRSIYIFSR